MPQGSVKPKPSQRFKWVRRAASYEGLKFGWKILRFETRMIMFNVNDRVMLKNISYLPRLALCPGIRLITGGNGVGGNRISIVENLNVSNSLPSGGSQEKLSIRISLNIGLAKPNTGNIEALTW